MANRKNTPEHFIHKADTNGGQSSCWPWMASRFRDGYGQFSLNGRNRRAHRVAWEVTHGLIPDGMLVCHRCDNRHCVNPAHLFLGTPADNSADMARKGRAAKGLNNGSYTRPHRRRRGSQNGASKLTADIVLSIRGDGRSLRDIAATHGVTKSLIGQIKRRTAWAWL